MLAATTKSGLRRFGSGPRILRGFTLLELVIVMLIIGLMASVAMPRFANSQALRRVEAAANRVSADLEMARRRARISSTAVTVSFDALASSYELQGVADLDRPSAAYEVLLAQEPYGVDIVSVSFGGDTAVTFNGYGLPNKAGTISLAVGSYGATVTLALDGGRAVQEVGVAAVVVEVEAKAAKAAKK